MASCFLFTLDVYNRCVCVYHFRVLILPWWARGQHKRPQEEQKGGGCWLLLRLLLYIIRAIFNITHVSYFHPHADRKTHSKNNHLLSFLFFFAGKRKKNIKIKKMMMVFFPFGSRVSFSSSHNNNNNRHCCALSTRLLSILYVYTSTSIAFTHKAK